MAKREVLPELPSQTAPKVVDEAPVRQKAAAPPPPAAPAEQKMTISDMAKSKAAPVDEAKSARADNFARPEPAAVALEVVPRAAKEEDRRRLAAGAVAGFVPVPYHVLQADTSGNYIERLSSAVFGSTDRIRIAFDPPRDGHLRAITGSDRVLADADVVGGETFNVDVPPGETRIIVAFTGPGDTIPTSFEIQIRRE
jgi:hypothetical protein